MASPSIHWADFCRLSVMFTSSIVAANRINANNTETYRLSRKKMVPTTTSARIRAVKILCFNTILARPDLLGRFSKTTLTACIVVQRLLHHQLGKIRP